MLTPDCKCKMWQEGERFYIVPCQPDCLTLATVISVSEEDGKNIEVETE